MNLRNLNTINIESTFRSGLNQNGRAISGQSWASRGRAINHCDEHSLMALSIHLRQ